MEVAPFFVDFHHFFVDFHDLRTFVAIYILSRFSHFFRKFFLAKISISATKRIIFMYGLNGSYDSGRDYTGVVCNVAAYYIFQSGTHVKT